MGRMSGFCTLAYTLPGMHTRAPTAIMYARVLLCMSVSGSCEAGAYLHIPLAALGREGQQWTERLAGGGQMTWGERSRAREPHPAFLSNRPCHQDYFGNRSFFLSVILGRSSMHTGQQSR